MATSAHMMIQACTLVLAALIYTHIQVSYRNLDTQSRRKLWCDDLGWKNRRQPPGNPGTAQDFKP